ncbi:MAG TPA: MAPEG family protein [Methylophilaceae bacterium]|jgi:uncharacterized membrane protein YecN with MAPEG domain|nr:MAPEG family protein [Methylophilaceae bacterium]
MMLAIVPLYAALLALLFVALSIRVIKTRRQERVAIGDGDNPRLRRAIGVHNNFAQYVPLALLLLAFVELAAAPILLVHILCLMLLIGRCVHAYGVSQNSENYRLRSIGIWLTFASIALAALYLLVTTLIRLVIAS